MDDPHPVAQQRAAARPRRGIDGDYADRPAGASPRRDQGGAKGGFADARRTGDADDMRPRLAPCGVEQRLRGFAVGIALQAGEGGGQGSLAVRAERRQRPVLSGSPSAACAAASRAIGTR